MTEQMDVDDNKPIKVNTFYRVTVTHFGIEGPIETHYFRTINERDAWLTEHDVPPMMSNRDGEVVYADLGEYKLYSNPVKRDVLLVSYTWGIAMLTEESQRWFGLTLPGHPPMFTPSAHVSVIDSTMFDGSGKPFSKPEYSSLYEELVDWCYAPRNPQSTANDMADELMRMFRRRLAPIFEELEQI